MRIRLGGWLRLGIVTSVIWAFGISLRQLGKYLSDVQDQALTFSTYITDCESRFGRGAEQCIQLENGLFAQAKTYGFVDWHLFAGFVIVPIIIGWATGYVLIHAARWIRSGFKNAHSA